MSETSSEARWKWWQLLILYALTAVGGIFLLWMFAGQYAMSGIGGVIFLALAIWFRWYVNTHRG